mgnify:CR=1 FL=1
MGRYQEAEDRDSADSVVVNLESYRRRRALARQDTKANQEPRGKGEEGAGATNVPIEGSHKD